MSTTYATAVPQTKSGLTEQGKKTLKPLSWAAFSVRYLSREDGYKYEWIDGRAEKSPRTMNTAQIYIRENLDHFLDALRAKNPQLGRFHSETDIFLTPGRHRRPDIAYFTPEQVRSGKSGEPVIPEFVIEVISPTDNINRVNKKVRQYFEAGVKVIWHIFPEQQEVYVYENPTRINVCRDEHPCSAESVIPGFALPARDVFA